MKWTNRLFSTAFTGVMGLLLMGCPPQADFTVDPSAGTVPLQVDFTDTSSNVDPNDITAWFWAFGDGGTSTQQNPSHTYNQVGCFDVTLTIFTNTGQYETTSTNAVCVSAEGEGEGEGEFEGLFEGEGASEGEGEGEGAGEGECDPACEFCDEPIDANFSLSRTVLGDYTPGGTVDIQVTLNYTGGNTVYALGLREFLPVGWTFNSYVSGTQPGVQDLDEATGVLEFAYFNIPTFPATFTYRVDVPGNATGVLPISGCGELRFISDTAYGTPLEEDTISQD